MPTTDKILISFLWLLVAVSAASANSSIQTPAPTVLGTIKLAQYSPANRTALATKLAQYLRSLSCKDRDDHAYKLLAIALCLDPENREAVTLNGQRKRGLPIPVIKIKETGSLVTELLACANAAKQEDESNAQRLYAYLIDLALLVDKNNEDAIFQQEILRTKDVQTKWNAFLSETTAATVSPEKDPKKFSKLSASVTGLFVTINEHQVLGTTLKIIATAKPLTSPEETKSQATFARSDIQKDMRIAMDEAMRVLSTRNPKLAPFQATISFQDKYSPKGGPSAAVAFTLLLISMAEGIELDDTAAVTGDITVDGNVQPVGGIGAKIGGAIDTRCQRVAIPLTNVRDAYDLLHMKSFRQFCKIHVLTISTVEEAIATIRKDQHIDHIKGYLLLRKVQNRLLKKGRSGFNSKTYTALKEVKKLIPNSLSARILMEYQKNKLRYNVLSVPTSVDEVFRCNAPLLKILKKNNSISSVSKQSLKDARKEMRKVERILHPDVRKLHMCFSNLLRSLESLVGYYNSGASRNHQAVANLLDFKIPKQLYAWNSELRRLRNDNDFQKKLNH